MKRKLIRGLGSLVALLVLAAPTVTDAQDQDWPNYAYAQETQETQESQTSGEAADLAAHAAMRLGDDEVTIRQSVDMYTTLEDGQPAAPGDLQIQIETGWRTTSGKSDPFDLEPELQYTPTGGDFFHNMQLQLKMPWEIGNGGIDGNGDLEFGWQQRWVRESGNMPTLASLALIRFPSGYQSAGVDGTFTGIVAKDFGPGTAYLNGFLKTANGNNVENLRHFQWGLRAGYQYHASENLSFLLNYVHQSSEQTGHANSNTLELGTRYFLTDRVTIGPGIQIGLDDNEETPNFGAGVRVMIGL